MLMLLETQMQLCISIGFKSGMEKVIQKIKQQLILFNERMYIFFSRSVCNYENNVHFNYRTQMEYGCENLCRKK